MSNKQKSSTVKIIFGLLSFGKKIMLRNVKSNDMTFSGNSKMVRENFYDYLMNFVDNVI